MLGILLAGITYLPSYWTIGTFTNENICKREAYTYITEELKKPIVDGKPYYKFYPGVNNCEAITYEKL